MMNSFSIGIDFVTGRSVAATVNDRTEPEWPPHPGRVFMALAASCFERGEDPAEVAALEWLESLPAPQICASKCATRSRVKFYVPINDKLAASKSLLQSTPGLARSKQERSYPTAIPHDPIVYFTWDESAGLAEHLEALTKVCENVIRVGHSSSLVRCWIDTNSAHESIESARQRDRWQPVDVDSKLQARVASTGEFSRLRVSCNAETIERFAELKTMIEESKGAAKTEAKKVFEVTFSQPYKASLRPPEPTPPVLGSWQGYRITESMIQKKVVEGDYFDSELLILGLLEGANIGLQNTLALTRRLRDAAMSHCPQDPPPAWLGGHDADGKPTKDPHAAFLALPFVGREYADGHIMGLAIATPKAISPQDRGRLLGHLLIDEEGESRNVELKLGKLGIWLLRLEDRADPPLSIQNQSWTKPSTRWASVTPVVLDKFPKCSRSENRSDWNEEVFAIIAESCKRAGLPQPLEIDLDTTSWHLGSPRAYPKQRTYREEDNDHKRASFGDGFPPMPSREGKPARPQIHVYLRFADRIRGPVVIGAGRFFGYGLCKPLKELNQP